MEGARLAARKERPGVLSGLEIFRRLDRSCADPPGGTPRLHGRRGRPPLHRLSPIPISEFGFKVESLSGSEMFQRHDRLCEGPPGGTPRLYVRRGRLTLHGPTLPRKGKGAFQRKAPSIEEEKFDLS